MNAWAVVFVMLVLGYASVPEAEQNVMGKPPVAGFRLVRLPLPLILHGEVREAELREIGQTRFWLKNQLQVRGIKDIRTVYMATIDYRGRFFTLLNH
ncbi:MAG TPA: YetF domain-containing protein [Bacilli bacterium]